MSASPRIRILREKKKKTGQLVRYNWKIREKLKNCVFFFPRGFAEIWLVRRVLMTSLYNGFIFNHKHFLHSNTLSARISFEPFRSAYKIQDERAINNSRSIAITNLTEENKSLKGWREIQTSFDFSLNFGTKPHGSKSMASNIFLWRGPDGTPSQNWISMATTVNTYNDYS